MSKVYPKWSEVELYGCVEEFFAERDFPYETEENESSASFYATVGQGRSGVTLDITLEPDELYISFSADLKDLYDASDCGNVLGAVNEFNSASSFLKATLSGGTITLGAGTYITPAIAENILGMALSDLLEEECRVALAKIRSL